MRSIFCKIVIEFFKYSSKRRLYYKNKNIVLYNIFILIYIKFKYVFEKNYDKNL
jgi:hypothetical protein